MPAARSSAHGLVIRLAAVAAPDNNGFAQLVAERLQLRDEFVIKIRDASRLALRALANKFVGFEVFGNLGTSFEFFYHFNHLPFFIVSETNCDRAYPKNRDTALSLRREATRAALRPETTFAPHA